MDRLREMETFVRIVERGSLTAAAAALDVSLPTVVRVLAAVEKRLAVRLLQRTTRRIALTDEGRQFYERSRRILSEVEDAEANLSSVVARGLLRITAPVQFGRMHLQPVVLEFARKYPEVTVEFFLVDRTVDLVEEELHLGVRIGHLPSSSLVASPVGEVRLVLCASPRYLARAKTPTHPRDLAQHDCLRFTGFSRVPEWSFNVSGEVLKMSVSGQFYSNQVASLIDACVDGLGIGRFMSYQVAALVATRRLRLVLDEYAPPPLPVNVLTPGVELLPARTRLMLEWLRKKLPPRLVACRLGLAQRKRASG
jgi:DNA-binding transcriptional LysR family regulator